MENNDIIHIAFADDHVSVRVGIAAYLEGLGGIKVDIQESNGLVFLEQLKSAPVLPDVCIIDIHMPVMDGFTLIKEIKRLWPGMRVLVLTVSDRELFIIRMIRGGANGYLLKSCDLDEIKAALQAIHRSGVYYSGAANSVLFQFAKGPKIKLPHFTDNEIELLRYSCTEMSYGEIAKKMNTTKSSIEGCRDRIFSKLGVNSRVGMAMFAVHSGIEPIEILKSTQSVFSNKSHK